MHNMSFTRTSYILLTLLAWMNWTPTSLHAEEESKKTLFLPKNATAAAYVLGRLSHQELIEAPRNEFVYAALLQRKGLARKYRVEALDGLAKIRGTDTLTELLGGLEAMDKKSEDSTAVLRDLSPILFQSKPEELSAKHSTLEKLASASQLPLTRQIGFAAMVTSGKSIDSVWEKTQSDTTHLVDLIRSLEFIPDSTLRAAFYPKVEPLLHKQDSPELRQAAIAAIVAIPRHDAETFKTLAALVKSGTERTLVIASLEKIPRKSWPKDQAESLVESLVAHLKNMPVERRTDDDAIGAFQFATDLAALLPPEKAQAIGKALRGLGVSIFVVRTLPEKMLYDKTFLVVEAGKPMEIILQNDDAMPHNLVVVAPDALEEIGQLAEKMAPTPDAQGRLYVPGSPKVLHATKLVEPGQKIKLSFTAPSEPGNYSYVCTFPGHWRLMFGTLAIVKDVEAYLAERAKSTEPKITEWKIEDFTSEIAKAGSGRNLARGKELYTKLACAGCHKLGKEGIVYGPELTKIFQQYNNDRAMILRQILEPSLVISNRYRNIQFEIKNDEPVLGMIVKEDVATVTVQTGPAAALIQTLKKSDIKERQPQTSSAMPTGLLNSLSKEEIFDLLAYLESGGNSSTHQHNH